MMEPPNQAGRITIACPDCGHNLVVRTNSAEGSRFLGCADFPRCRHTQPLPAYVSMLEAGAEMLPGFGS